MTIISYIIIWQEHPALLRGSVLCNSGIRQSRNHASRFTSCNMSWHYS